MHTRSVSIRATSRKIALSLIFLLSAIPVWANIDTPHTLSIEANDLTSALLELARITDITLIITEQLNSSGKTYTLSGTYTPRAAINELLKHTNLNFTVHAEDVISIYSPPQTEESSKQEPPPEKAEWTKVIGYRVTGTRIKRHDIDGFSPLDIITAPEIERAGAQNLADLFKFIPAVSGNSTSTAVSNGGDGTTKVTLRGLPANNTLVLVDGQRVVFDGLAGDSVDLSTLAPIAIDRIEILKDGASAIYGADAIAGVVNIVLKEQYQGTKIEQYAGTTSRGDTETYTSNLLFGRTGAKHSFLATASYYQQAVLYSRDRELSASADGRPQGGIDQRSGTTTRTRLTLDENTSLILNNDEQGRPLSGENISDFRAYNEEERFDFRQQTSAISPSQRIGLYSNLSSRLNDNITLKHFVLASQTDATINLAATPISTQFIDNPITISRDNIYNPFGQDISDARRRLIELGPRTQRNQSTNLYAKSGFRYTNEHREWSFNAYWNQTNATQTRKNLVDGERLRRALGPTSGCQGKNIDGCVPFNIFGPPGSVDNEQLAFVAAETDSNGLSRIFGINSYFANTAASVKTREPRYVIGFAWRSESSELLPDASKTNNLIGSVTTSPTKGERDVAEIYGEVSAPLLKRGGNKPALDLELATRYTKSSDYGENISPKLGLIGRLNSDLMLRSTLSYGFRAPSISERFKNGDSSFARLFDPCSREDNVGFLPGCTQQSDPTINQFLTEFTGSEDLDPEISTNFSFGFFLTPTIVRGLSISADMFTIKQRNVIEASPQTIISENASSGRFADLVQRDTNGNIIFLQAPFINVATRKIEGLDLSLFYSPATPISFNFNASYLHRYVVQLNEFAEEIDLAGTFEDAAESGSGSLPRWKLNLGGVWQGSGWEWAYDVNYVSSIRETIRSSGEAKNIKRTIKPWLSHNTQWHRQFNNLPVHLTFGVDNLFDEAPPFAATAFNDNYDARTYDLKGRFFYGKVSFEF